VENGVRKKVIRISLTKLFRPLPENQASGSHSFHFLAEPVNAIPNKLRSDHLRGDRRIGCLHRELRDLAQVGDLDSCAPPPTIGIVVFMVRPDFLLIAMISLNKS
jgi:hypothetical protein